MPTIITRPATQAMAWVQALQAQGVDAVALPLIDIGPADDPQALQTLWQRVYSLDGAESFDACMCISSNAALYFFAQDKPETDAGYAQEATKNIAVKLANKTLRWWATGAGTVRALQDCGISLPQIDAPGQDAAQWDSEHLWARVQHQITHGKKVLILRGSDVGTASASRDWLAQQIDNAGGTVEIAITYQRRRPVWSAAEKAAALQHSRDGSVWIWSSSQALGHLLQLLPGHDWSHARCVATHPRIAQAAHEAGFGVVCTSRPGWDEVVRSIKSLHV